MVQEEELVGLPRDVVPEEGTGTKVAYDLMTNELLLDGSARLNLATFVTTWMPPDAARLMAETADKNMIDKDDYPRTAEFERRCVNMIGRLWHAPGDGDVTGCSTTGSSEAAMLGGLALKWLWRERMKAAGKPTDRPNLVLGIKRGRAERSDRALLAAGRLPRAGGRPGRSRVVCAAPRRRAPPCGLCRRARAMTSGSRRSCSQVIRTG
jgi:glutamate decarboxylase